jgi:hypothetical protein
MRDPVTGDLALGPHVTVVTSHDEALAVLRDCDRFLQWDGSFRTASGELVQVGAVPAGTDVVVLGSTSSRMRCWALLLRADAHLP